MQRTIVRNAAWLFSGQALGRLIRAGFLIYAARLLGASSWGAFSYALGIVTFLTILSDIGVNALLTREVSRDQSLLTRYLSTAFYLKLALVATFSLLTLALLPLLTLRIPEARVLIPLLLFVYAFDALRDLGVALIRALQTMRGEALSLLATNIAIFGFGILLLRASPSSASLSVAYALGTLSGLVWTFVALRGELSGLLTRFDASLLYPLLTSAWSFGLVGLMGTLMMATDTIILGLLVSPAEVGFYAAAQRPAQLIYLIPNLIAIALFPALARVNRDAAAFRGLVESGLATALLLALPLAAGGALLASPLMTLLYGAAYLPGSSTLLILSLTFLTVFPSVIVVHALFAHERPQNFLPYVALGLIGNILLDLVLIPRLGIAGSALASLINQSLVGTYGLYRLYRLAPFSIIPRLPHLAIGAGVMTVIVLITSTTFALPVILVVPLGGIAYLGTLLALKEPSLTGLVRGFSSEGSAL